LILESTQRNMVKLNQQAARARTPTVAEEAKDRISKFLLSSVRNSVTPSSPARKKLTLSLKGCHYVDDSCRSELSWLETAAGGISSD